MITNLIKVALRNIQRQKFYAILNILGLAIGITSCLFITIYIADELSYDQFHEKADRIYRIDQTFIWGEIDNHFGSTGPAVAAAVATEIPEFETLTRIHTVGPQVITVRKNEKITVFEEPHLLAADSNFFEVFTFPMEAGDYKTALVHPNSILLTRQTAEKYFGDEEALGQLVQIGEPGNEKPFKVTGILKDLPSNSHLQFDMLTSMSSYPRVKSSSWSWIWTTFVTFGVLNPEADVAAIEQRLLKVPAKHAGSSLQRLQGISFEEYAASGKKWELFLQPFLDIHLRAPEAFSRLGEVGDIKMMYILGSVGILILMISLINFMNLATARSASRAKEVGIRKVIGSGKKHLIFQFLVESIMFSLIALVISLILTELLMPWFNYIAGKELAYSILNHPVHIAGLMLIGGIIGIIAGTYPAFYLTSFQPVAVLKGKLKSGVRSGGIRNALVVLQFMISIVFIASTLIVFKQLSFTTNYNLGFDRDNKVIIKNVHRLGASMTNYAEQLKNYPQVQNVTISEATPPFFWNNDNFSLKGSEKEDFPLSYVVSDENFLPVYGIELIAGRNFDKQLTDHNRLIVNEAFLRHLNFVKPEDALQKVLKYYDQEMTIIGVVKDFNPSFSTEILPWALIYEGSDVFLQANRRISVHFNQNLSSDEIQQFVSNAESLWGQFSPNLQFNYSFLDQEYQVQYASIEQFGGLLGLFTVLAIVIASLGLIGLIAFVIEKRSKEIGIRKVLGATIANILVLLSKEFGKLLIIGFVIATPIAWYLMDMWLQDFQYRTNITWWVFVAAGVVMLLIAFATTSFQTIKAALTNPVDSIKDE